MKEEEGTEWRGEKIYTKDLEKAGMNTECVDLTGNSGISSLHINRPVASESPNPCFKGLAATLSAFGFI